MAIIVKDKVNINDINEEFTTVVIDSILSGAYDMNNVPRDGSYYCIEPEKLGDKNNLPKANSGIKNTIISGIGLYNNLVALTTVLTRVGTFSYVRTYQVNSEHQVQASLSGKALYNDSYVKELASVPTDSISNGTIITSSSINKLFSDLLTAWRNTVKHHNTVTVRLCHSNCHSDCHSNCHDNSDCYK